MNDTIVRKLNLGSDRRTLIFALLLVDGLMLVLAVGFAAALRFVLDGVLPVSSLVQERHLLASVLVVPVLLLLFRLEGLYDIDQILTGTREYSIIARSATFGVVIGLGVSYFSGGGPLVSRSWIILTWISTIFFACLGRFCARRVVRLLRRKGALRTRVVVVGASSFGVELAKQLSSSQQEGVDVVGFLDEYLPLGHPLWNGVTVIGRPDDLLQPRPFVLADEVILVPQALPHQRAEELTRLLVARGGSVLRVAMSSGELLTHGVHIIKRASVPLVTVRRASISGTDAALKRGLDVIGACLGLLVLTPLAGLQLAQHLILGEPLPRHRRRVIYGLGRERMSFWLFEPNPGMWIPLRGLPALAAVLGGRLSLVGPQPIEWDPTGSAPVGLALTSVRPGLTGPWRLAPPEASLAEQAAQDLAYVRGYSIWEDLRILWQSVRRLHTGRSAVQLRRWYQGGFDGYPRLIAKNQETSREPQLT